MRRIVLVLLLVLCSWGSWAQSGIITTIAGTGSSGYSGDGGAATSAYLHDLTQFVAVDGSGNLFIADAGNNRIRKVSSSGIITTIAGTGTYSYSGDGGAATSAMLSYPWGVAVDGSGNLYIADRDNHRIRKVSSSGIITTIAGTGTAGFSGDGGAATSARLRDPQAVAVDGSGNLYYADQGTDRIRKVSSSGVITTIAGNGTFGFGGDGGAATSAQLNNPLGLAVDGSGNLYIADYGNHRIRKVSSSGIITTIAGNGTAGFSGDGGAATAAMLSYPSGLAVDGSGNLYIAEPGNNRIRKVSASGIITTIAGTDTGGFSGDGGAATSAELSLPTGVAVDGSGNLYIADNGNVRIRKITACTAPTAGTITGLDSVCTASTITLSNTITGGTWSSSNTVRATVNSAGVVTGVSAGSVVVSYSVTNSCGTAVATKNITVNPAPTAGTITGLDSVCTASTITLTNTITGGSWSSSNTARATVSSVGVVTGVSAGSVVVSYSVTNSCGTSVATRSITVNSATSLPCYLPTSGLVAWYPFNGNANDESGSGNDLTNNGGVNYSTDRFGNAYSCAQFDSLGQYFSKSIPNMITGNSNRTISVWINESSYQTLAPSIIKLWGGRSAGCFTDCAIYLTDSSGFYFAGRCEDKGWNGFRSLRNLNNWYHTLLCYRNDSVFLYINNTLINSASSASYYVFSNRLNTPSYEFLVGSPGYVDWMGYFKGKLDDIAIYNRALSSSEISQLYNSGRTASVITGPTSVTTDSTITLSDSTIGGTWSSSNTSRAAVNSSGVVRGVSAGSVTISYTVTNSCGTSRATKNVNVIAPTNAPIFIVGTPSFTTACKNQSKIISDNIRVRDIDSGQTLTWSLYRAPRFGTASVTYSAISNSGIIRPPSDRLYTPNTNYVGNDTFMVCVTDGTYSSYITIYVTVNPTPSTPIISGDTTLCRSASTTLTATPSGGTWLRNTSNLSVSSAGVVSSITSGAIGFTDYITYFTPLNSFGCKNSARHYITVPSMPASISITGSSIGTVGGTANYTSAIAGGAWSVRDSAIAYFSSGGVANFTGVGTTIISYIANRCGRTFNATKTVSVAAAKQQGIVKQEVTATQEISVYPNPTTGELNIDLPMQQANLMLFDINGKLMSQHEANSHHPQLDLSNYPKGIYMLVIGSEGNKWVHRVILQ